MHKSEFWFFYGSYFTRWWDRKVRCHSCAENSSKRREWMHEIIVQDPSSSFYLDLLMTIAPRTSRNFVQLTRKRKNFIFWEFSFLECEYKANERASAEGEELEMMMVFKDSKNVANVLLAPSLLFLEASRRFASTRSNHQTHIVKSRSSIMACNGNVLLIFMRHEISNLRLEACKCRQPSHTHTLETSPFRGNFLILSCRKEDDDALILGFNRQQTKNVTRILSMRETSSSFLLFESGWTLLSRQTLPSIFNASRERYSRWTAATIITMTWKS